MRPRSAPRNTPSPNAYFHQVFFGRVVRSWTLAIPRHRVFSRLEFRSRLADMRASVRARCRRQYLPRRALRSLLGPSPRRPSSPGPLRGMAQRAPLKIEQIKAHLHHGLGPTAIASFVKKADGVNVSLKQSATQGPSSRGARHGAESAPLGQAPLAEGVVVLELVAAISAGPHFRHLWVIILSAIEKIHCK